MINNCIQKASLGPLFVPGVPNLGGAWDSALAPGVTTYANSDRSLTFGSDGWSKSVNSFASGKTYFEVTFEVWASPYGPDIGIIPVTSNDTRVGGMSLYIETPNNMRLINNGSLTAFNNETTAQGDVIGVLVDLDARTVEFFKNGTSLGIGFTNIVVQPYRAAIQAPHIGYSGVFTANFGTAT